MVIYRKTNGDADEDDVLEQLDAQDKYLIYENCAYHFAPGDARVCPSLFVDNDEEIVEYAVKPLLAKAARLTILMLHCV